METLVQSKELLDRWREDDRVQEEIKNLDREIREATKESISTAGPKSLFKLLDKFNVREQGKALAEVMGQDDDDGKLKVLREVMCDLIDKKSGTLGFGMGDGDNKRHVELGARMQYLCAKKAVTSYEFWQGVFLEYGLDPSGEYNATYDGDRIVITNEE